MTASTPGDGGSGTHVAAGDTTGSGLWICCDGVEGAGKTTLTNALADALQATIAPEFSMSATGRALHRAVQKAPHYISASTWGQSLAFIGDFHEVYETSVLPALGADAVVISDRGWLSKYAYQAQVLTGTFEVAEIDRRLLQVLAVPRMPDLTFHLDADVEILVERLLERDGACPPERVEFVAGARERYDQFVDRLGEPGMPALRVRRLSSVTQQTTLQEALTALHELRALPR